jgi:hypothetical protein
MITTGIDFLNSHLPCAERDNMLFSFRIQMSPKRFCISTQYDLQTYVVHARNNRYGRFNVQLVFAMIGKPSGGQSEF